MLTLTNLDVFFFQFKNKSSEVNELFANVNNSFLSPLQLLFG